MKLSRSWLQSYVDLAPHSDDEIARAITFLGFEVEGIHATGAPALNHVYVGKVLTRDQHPNADRLSVCTVEVGPVHGLKRIVCGAQNYKVGDHVPVALVGAVLPGDFTIKESKIRGEASFGMMCSAKELTLAEDADGLLLLAGQPAPGTPINDILPPGDVVFDVEITPNRPDCQCHLGLARELAAWFRQDFTYPEVSFTPAHADSKPRPDLLKTVRVDAPEDCPLYTATVITGVKIGPSPDWMQRRLTAAGLRPVNNVVDIGNYVMLEYGQPVHAFDARRLAGASLIVRVAAEGEQITTLDGKRRPLTAGTLLIADAEKPVVIAGIMGSEESGVSEATTDLVLEVAVFKRQTIRRATRRLGLSSDSAYRYERGVDPHSLDEAMHRCLDLLLAHAGGTVAGPTLRVGADIPWQREITVTPAYINERLGFEILPGDQLASLESLELSLVREEPTDNRGPAWTFSVPSWRDDLDRPIDLVEEVLRLHGTEKIPVTTVQAPGLVALDDPIVLFNRAVTDTLVGQSFQECVNYTLRAGSELKEWVSEAAAADLALSNPFVEDQSHLRPTLVMGLLENLKLNQARGVSAPRLFETGRVFIERHGQNFECVAVGFVLAEDDRPSWCERAQPDFYTAKRLVETLAATAGVDLGRQPLAPVTGAYFGWQEGHSAVGGDMVHGWTARFGLLNLAMVKALGVTGQVYAGIFAILPEKLPATGPRRRYQPLPQFPAALRDLALVVEEATPAGEVQKALAKIARGAVGKAFGLEAVQVFDVYQGQGLPEGKKSLAFSLGFRAPERTLTDAEVNAVFTQIQDEISATTPYVIRK